MEPCFYYRCIVWDGIGYNLAEKFQKLQNRAARIDTSASYSKLSKEVLSELGWQTLKEWRHKEKAIWMFEILNEWLQHTWKTCLNKKLQDSMYLTFELRIKKIAFSKQEQTIIENVLPLLQINYGMLCQTIWKRSILSKSSKLSSEMSISPSKRNELVHLNIYRNFSYCIVSNNYFIQKYFN